MTVLRNGNIGLGTTQPVFKLDVRNGSINTDSEYRIGTITALAMPDISNIFVGADAGKINTSGYNNTFMGNRSGKSNTIGNYNSFIGWNAGNSNTEGLFNSFFGVEAGTSNTRGSYNSFFGVYAGLYDTTGDYNSFFGVSAGLSNTTGTFNSALGTSADFNTGVLNNATVIGYGAIVDASNKVRIGNILVTSIGGQVGWSTFSDGRFKLQVQEDVQGLAFIKKLRTVSYLVDLTTLNKYYSSGNSDLIKSSSLQDELNHPSPEIVRQSGFIAQEVEQAARDLGFSFSGIDIPQNEKALYGLRYGDFVVPLVKAVQEQQAIIEEQNKKIEMLIREINVIKEKLR